MADEPSGTETALCAPCRGTGRYEYYRPDRNVWEWGACDCCRGGGRVERLPTKAEYIAARRAEGRADPG